MGRLVLLGGRGTKVNLTKLGRPRRLAVAVSLGFVAILILVWIVASRPRSALIVGTESARDLVGLGAEPGVSDQPIAPGLARETAVSRGIVLVDCTGNRRRVATIIASINESRWEIHEDTSGRFPLPEDQPASDVNSLIVLESSGAASYVASNPAKFDGTARVFVKRPSLIGEVVAPADVVRNGGCRLLCLPASLAQRLATEPNEVLRSPQAYSIDVHADGRFSACDLAPGEWVCLCANQNWIGAATASIEVGEQRSVVLRLQPAAGLALQLLDPDGGPPRLSELAWSLSTWSEVQLPPELVRLGWHEAHDLRPLAVFAGMNPALSGTATGAFLHLFVGDSSDAAGFAIQLEASSAGYRRVRMQVGLTPVDEMKSARTITLERQAGEALLRVRIINAPPCTPTMSTIVPVFRLRLSLQDDPEVAPFELNLSGVQAGDREFPQLPPGRYQVRGRDLLRNLKITPSRSIDLRDGEVTTLELDASATGCVLLVPEAGEGCAFTGQLQVQVLEERTPRGTPFRLVEYLGPPYIVPFLPGGARSFLVHARREGLSAKVTATVVGGAVTEVRPHLSPK